MYLYFQKCSTIKVVDKAFQTNLFGFWTFETLFDAFKEFWGKQLRHNITRIKNKISQESKWHLNKLLVLDTKKRVVGKAKYGGDKPALGSPLKTHHITLTSVAASQHKSSYLLYGKLQNYTSCPSHLQNLKSQIIQCGHQMSLKSAGRNPVLKITFDGTEMTWWV